MTWGRATKNPRGIGPGAEVDLSGSSLQSVQSGGGFPAKLPLLLALGGQRVLVRGLVRARKRQDGATASGCQGLTRPGGKGSPACQPDGKNGRI
jgi:hypothetical protein